MFTDRLKLKLIAGKGGNGTVAWRREKYIPKGGPYGGNGGPGGNVLIRTSAQLQTLDHLRNTKHIKAENGGDGGSNNKQGKLGKDATLQVPCGTLVKNALSKEVLCDLTQSETEILLCSGGKGGKGNAFFKTSKNRAPTRSTPGTLGESTDIELELKLIADVGFIGMPNAGKSSLLNFLTNAPAKVGAYPFTTLHPNLRMLEFDDFSRIYLADIPGIIPKAAEGKGLGLDFLRHIERTEVLLYVIDASGEEGRSPLDDFMLLQQELQKYSQAVMDKPSLIALNKIDKPQALENIKQFQQKLSKHTTCSISALSGQGVASLLQSMRALVEKQRGIRY